ncbi:MAG: Chaperone protein DnaJ 2 [Nitrosomonadaceae bacterium]|nr:Chaperone protein DnaJ 2 [Nitrosomonadaceae bacterium]
MSHRDIKGYYTLLGVSPDAPSSTIKSAYRKRALELHPDKNPGKNTTAPFQALQQAYDVLSDQKQREQYDAESSSPVTQTRSKEDTPKPLDPIVCSACKSVTAQPRFRVFYYVISYLLGATKNIYHGIYCSKCETKVALKSTLITLLVGWWSFPGFVWTLHSLVHNLSGGLFYEQNARLQGHQAWYFAANGKFSLGRACAIEGLRLIEKGLRCANIFGLGRTAQRKTADELKALRGALESLLGSLPANTEAVHLKPTDGFLCKRFLYQAILLLAVAGILSEEVYRHDQHEKKIERARLEREGIDRANAAAIAARETEALKRLEQPLPKTGVFRVVNGRSYAKNDAPPLLIENVPFDHALIKLIRTSNGAEVMRIFVRAGESVEVYVPVGTYKAKLAYGQTWYGDAVRFGPSTKYAELDGTFEFKIEGLQLQGHRLTLTRVTHGNLREHSLNASDF